MMTTKKEITKKEIAQIVRRLNSLMRLAKVNPLVVTNFTEKFLGKDVAMDISKEIEALDIIPQVALIGRSRVGKSSTINKLFNPQPNLPVDHVEPATMNIEVITLSLGERGKLIIVDSPGLGVSEDADRRNMAAYREILAESDVAVWVIKGDDRTLGIDQSFITQVLPEKLRSRLVVGINQVDKIKPVNWSEEFNLPSKEQEINIQQIEKNILSRFITAGIEPFAVVSYSALRNYRLTKLFRTMVDACPPEKIAAFVRSGDIQSFLSPNLR